MATDTIEVDFLIGYIGKDILRAIYSGCKTIETIYLFSGCPISCVKGRIPVLIDLDLIEGTKGEYEMTQNGKDFLSKI